MTQTELLELAKQGRPTAIAALINRSLEPKGITAKAALKGRCLQITLAAPKVPNQKVLAGFIYQGVMKLAPEAIASLKVLGLQTGQKAPAWSQEFKLSPQAEFSEELSAIAPVEAPVSRTGGSRKSPTSNPSPSVKKGKTPGRTTQSGNGDRLKIPPQLADNSASVPPSTEQTAESERRSRLTALDYEDLLRDIGQFPQTGKFSVDYYYAIPKIAQALAELMPSTSEILDVVGVRYQGQLACIVLTERGLACFSCPDFSRKAIKTFGVNLNKISHLSAGKRGLIIYQPKSLKKHFYFYNKRLGKNFIEGKLSEFISVEKTRFIPDDRHEVTLTLFGYFALFLSLLVNLAGLGAGVWFLIQRMMENPF
ncbi:hypothetical protein J0895_22635 [Phormidium pseudopriestleyi FRX01]|uniref:Uncharacterized protein n=1 Tax=Phormidium pseudopriestleyi FRX01 TaxID=1759528 RepID=A0ABS3FXH8_9CYAN|nr:hypothetical protein [Phormidium pseudopriestleyi]MBO0351826.1 hypothetical protein [Phormidium pseudopriestleyi FRX01]